LYFTKKKREKKRNEKKIVHRCHITPIHCEDLGEPLPIPPWMIVFVSPRSLHTPPEKRGLLLAGICIACANNFFLFIFLIYQKIILFLTQHNINKQTNTKIPKKPFNASYIFFCLQWHFSNCIFLMKKVHWCHIALIHYEDLEEPLPTRPWMVVFVNPRSIHAPQKNMGSFYSLAYALHVPIIFFLFNFLIYQKIILPLTQHDINKKTNVKIPKNLLIQAIYFLLTMTL